VPPRNTFSRRRWSYARRVSSIAVKVLIITRTAPAGTQPPAKIRTMLGCRSCAHESAECLRTQHDSPQVNPRSCRYCLQAPRVGHAGRPQRTKRYFHDEARPASASVQHHFLLGGWTLRSSPVPDGHRGGLVFGRS
jgi:hypothetical protein